MFMSENKIAIDLFCGAGGLSLGAELAGIKIKYAIENDCHSIKTYKANHKEVVLIERDIRDVSTSECPVKNPFIVFGGPPCQGFSLSNTRTRTISNEKNQLYNEFFRFVKQLEPKWFLFENVEGIVNFNGGLTLRNIKKTFQDLGYKIADAVLFASDYGVPQNRNRYFLVGNRDGIEFKFPERNQKKVTVWEAISDLPLLKNGAQYDELPYRSSKKISEYARVMRQGSTCSTQNFVSKNEDYIIERYKYIKQGQNWRAIPKELMVNYHNLENCHSGIYRRLRAHNPSIVISNYRKNMLIHPFQHRGLSVREAARIQSFPDTFKFQGTIWFIQQQIGNAVPPLMAKAIFDKILSYSKLFDNGSKRKVSSRLVREI
jgi:DNA (cytosine-5)-methyltransferase 1